MRRREKPLNVPDKPRRYPPFTMSNGWEVHMRLPPEDRSIEIIAELAELKELAKADPTAAAQLTAAAVGECWYAAEVAIEAELGEDRAAFGAAVLEEFWDEGISAAEVGVMCARLMASLSAPYVDLKDIELLADFGGRPAAESGSPG